MSIMSFLLDLPTYYMNIAISYATSVALPPALTQHMELAEQARMGKIDVSKLYRPILKMESFSRYFEIRNFVVILFIKFFIMTCQALVSGFRDPGILEYIWGVCFLYLFLLFVRMGPIDIRTINFVLTLLFLIGDFVTLYHKEVHTIPPVLTHLSTMFLMPLVVFHIMGPREAFLLTILVLIRFAYCLYLSIGKTFTLTFEDPGGFVLICLVSHLYPIYVLKTFDTDMRLFQSLLSKFLNVSEERSKEKTSFISRMSHELRTPLHGLLSSASLLRETSLTEEQNTFLSTIDKCGEVVMDVVVKILDITKIESGDFEKNVVDFSLFELMKNLTESVVTLADAKGLNLSILFDLHPMGFDVRGDKLHLREILINLIENAIKYTNFGSVTIRVKRQDAGWKHFSNYLFEIEDTGRGIDQADLETIFIPFRQVHGEDNQKQDGNGLGLSFAKKLAEALEGEIGVKSTLGSGSVFWVRLPMEPLIPGLLYPPLNHLPADSDSLSVTAGYFGAEEAAILEDLNKDSLFVGTNLTGMGLASVSHYFTSWGVRLEPLGTTPSSMGSFFGRGGSMVLLDSASQLPSLLATAVPFPQVLRVIVFTSLASFIQTNQIAAASPGSSKVRVLVKPYEPLKLYQGLLFLLGMDACLKSPSDTLPVLIPSKPVPAPGAKVPGPARPEALDVLVVEDNPVNQLVMKKVLERLNVSFQITPSGEAALRIWKGALHFIPLIFMDVEVEGKLNGLQVTSILRDLEKERDQNRLETGLPPLSRSHVVVLTGRAMVSDRQEAMARGCDEFVTKPVNVGNIQAIVRAHIRVGEN